VRIDFSALTALVGQQEEHLVHKIEWWGAGMVICLERNANDLYMVQLICHRHPIVSGFITIRNGSAFLVYRLTQVVLEKGPFCCC